MGNSPMLGSLKERYEAWIRYLGARSRLLQRLYCFSELSFGRIELGRKRFFRAIEHFCKASRRIQIQTRARGQAQEYLRAFYSINSGYRTLDDFLLTSRA